jgi:hypothetical protein
MGARHKREFGFIVCALLGTSLGCSSKDAMPRTYPVIGSVVSAKGQALAGGSIQFRPDSKDDVTVLGEIDKSGNFRLSTIKGVTRAEGAPEGSYTVSITAPQGADQQPLFAPITIAKKYLVEPKENRIEVRTDAK